MDVVVEQGAVLGMGQWHLYLLLLGVGWRLSAPRDLVTSQLSQKSGFIWATVWLFLVPQFSKEPPTVSRGVPEFLESNR